MNVLRWIGLYNPINAMARRGITSADDAPLSLQELLQLVDRLERKRRLLKLVLHIYNERQHRNFVYRYSKNISQIRVRKQPRAADEYIRSGKETQRLNQIISARKKNIC